jgi:O-antigen ligase
MDRAIVIGLYVLIAFTALAHGTVEAWSVAIFEILVILLLLLWALKVLSEKELKLKLPTVALPLAVFILIGLLQSVAIADSDGNRRSLSLDVEATRTATGLIFFLFLSFLLAANFLIGRERLKTLARFVAIYGLALAILAIVQQLTWEGSFYWVRPTRTFPFGPFVNRNHFAGYMELLIPIPVALIVARVGRFEERLFYGFAAAVMAIALIFSLSRGGMISLFTQMMFILAMSSRLAQGGMDGVSPLSIKLRQIGAVTAIVVAIVVGVFHMGADPVINRITGSAEESFYMSRGWIWRDTWALIRAHPFLGAGIGAYPTAYPIHSQYNGLAGMVAQSHNDYLQVVADSGMVGGMLALWFVITIFRAIGRGSCLPDPMAAGLTLGCGAAIFGILVHSLFEFNLQLPSHALLFLFLSAVVSQLGQHR